MLIFFVAVASVLGGIALCGLGVFLYFLYKSLKRLVEVTESVYTLVQPMTGGNQLREFLKAFQDATKTGKQITDGLEAITAVVANLNKLMHVNLYGAKDTEPPAKVEHVDLDDQNSWFKAPTEPEQANMEAMEDARAAGAPVNPEDEPPISGMVGASV